MERTADEVIEELLSSGSPSARCQGHVLDVLASMAATPAAWSSLTGWSTGDVEAFVTRAAGDLARGDLLSPLRATLAVTAAWGPATDRTTEILAAGTVAFPGAWLLAPPVVDARGPRRWAAAAFVLAVVWPLPLVAAVPLAVFGAWVPALGASLLALVFLGLGRFARWRLAAAVSSGRRRGRR